MKERIIVDLNNVNIYQKHKLILESVNLHIREGEFVYLVGRTGTGKSSLLKTLYGDLPMTNGIGTVVGFDLKDVTWKTVPFLRRKLGIIFQDFQLLMDRTVEDNLRFALEVTGWKSKTEMNQRIELVLENVYMMDKRFAMPYELSGGEQQRIAIARALLNDPELILADEPTGNLDPQTSTDIMRLLHQICVQTSTAAFIGTHDYNLFEEFPGRIVRCEAGKVHDSLTFHDQVKKPSNK